MTNRREFLHSSPLLVAESTGTDNPAKDPEAAICDETGAGGFVEKVRINQLKLTAELKPHYHFIVCGSGSSGSVVARRLAENPEVSVLLLEAGGSDDVPAVMDASKWATNLGGERFWDFKAQPNPALQGRALSISMGKVLGGGSSVNGMYWVRGHENDWNYFADARKRRAELAANLDYVNTVLADGAAKARSLAQTVLKRARRNSGLE